MSRMPEISAVDARAMASAAASALAAVYPLTGPSTSVFHSLNVRVLVSTDPLVHAVLTALCEEFGGEASLQGFIARLQAMAAVER